jgi:hypothetical protein
MADNKYIRLSAGALNKMFSQKTEDTEEITCDKGYMDKASVIMLIPKTQALKDYIISNFDVTEAPIPTLDYPNNEGGSNYSKEYMGILLSIIKNSNSDNIEIHTGRDFPLKVETKEMIFILAPRIL